MTIKPGDVNFEDQIILETNFRRIAQDRFEEIDYIVTGECFRLQNDYGRLFDEKVYRDELADRLRPLFSKVQTEVPITACFDGFQKPYFADLVIDDSALYELKVVSSLSPAHRSQTLSYLYLTELAHGKLVNFGSPKVETEFVSTTLDRQSRRNFEISFDLLDVSEDRSIWFWELMQRLLKHFGSFLTPSLFYDAIDHFADWEIVGDVYAGKSIQLAHLLTPQIGFKLTSYADTEMLTQSHLQKFLNHTSLSKIHWINIYRHQISAATLSKQLDEN